MYYVWILLNMHHVIKVKGPATKLAANSRQVHGPRHKATIESDELLEACAFKARTVFVMPDIMHLFKALRYKKDGELCVVTCPFTKPKKLEDERLFMLKAISYILAWAVC